MHTQEPIRIAVLTDRPSVRGWEAYILEKIRIDKKFLIVSIIETTSNLKAIVYKRRSIYKYSPWSFLDKFEQRTTGKLVHVPFLGGHDVDDEVALSSLVINSPIHFHMGVIPHKDTPIDLKLEEHFERIRLLNLDVIIAFGCECFRDRLSGLAAFGIWFLSHRDSRVNRAGPLGFWEFYQRSSVVGVELHVCRRPGDIGSIIKRAYFSNIILSWNGNRRKLLFNSSIIMLDELNRLARTREVSIERKDCPLDIYDYPLRGTPSAWTAVCAMAKIGWRIGMHLLQKMMTRKQWCIYVSHQSLEQASLHTFTPLFPPDDRFWADPFIIPARDRLWIFVEEFRFSKDFGNIAVLEIKDGVVLSTTTVIDIGSHMSYPYLFTFRDRLFMVPETAQAKTISLWECVEFPFRWEKRRDFLTGLSGVDSTLFEYNGRWWMFSNINRIGGDSYYGELHIFYTDDPIEGVWQPHIANPVKNDVQSARMGGGVIRWNEKLYRCAQQSGITYGLAAVIAEVQELTPETYSERVCATVEPNWDPTLFGLHHVNTNGGWTVVDALRRPSRFTCIYRSLLRVLSFPRWAGRVAKVDLFGRGDPHPRRDVVSRARSRPRR